MTRFERLFVWLGGAIFVAALGGSAYRYFVTWAVPPAAWSAGRAAVDAALLTIFAVHHSLFARDAVKKQLGRLLPQRLQRTVYVWVASLLLLTVVGLWAPVGGDLYQARGIAALALAIVQLGGIALIARSVAVIDPLDLAGIRTGRAHDALQVNGPYHLVRHPLYLGWVLVVFGAAHMTGDRLTFAVVTTLYLVIAVPWEEGSLLAAFGDDYVHYQQTVRWRIVPYVY